MVGRILVSLVALAAAFGAVLLAWPQLFGLQDAIVIAQVISFRAVLVLCAIGLVVLFALVRLVRPLRRLATALIAIGLLFALATTGILAVRGFSSTSTSAADADSITVLSWNTLGGDPGADAIAQLALDKDADIVTLPETTDEIATAVAEKMREGGRPMWALHLSFSDVYHALSTAVLISPDLGDYSVASAGGSGPPGNTNVSPTVIARPDDGVGPTIIAVHATSPLRGEMSNWRSDLDWLADQCGGGEVIMAGDFNATLDHMAGRGTDGGDLGKCHDAALANGAAAVGTWPSDVPKFLGAPIDHVMTTSQWKAVGFEVIDALDSHGSDHRPVVATLRRS
jgi:endonuclease/exonuclease/phosphatase (EEP) superfamily protein YafD